MNLQKLILLAAALVTVSAHADNIRFASHPSLSPDGKQIYFSYDGDIYSVPVGGGQATAVITMPGVQDSPLVSPDGKWLAFSSDIQGKKDMKEMGASSEESAATSHMLRRARRFRRQADRPSS